MQAYLSGHEEALDVLVYLSSVLNSLLVLTTTRDTAMTARNKEKLWRAVLPKKLTRRLSLTLHPDKAASGT